MNPSAQQFFITGIGTEVGKTFVAARLLQHYPFYRAIKPVMSGFDPCDTEACDAGQLLQAMGQEVTPKALDAVSPFRFSAPLSPHLAAAREGGAIATDELLQFCRDAMARHNQLYIEGVGGVMVPITPEWLVLDWMQALALPVILVSSSYLGAINHSLLSVEQIRRAGLSLHAVIISESEPDKDAGLQDTAEAVQPFLPESCALITLRREQDAQSAGHNRQALLSLSL